MYTETSQQPPRPPTLGSEFQVYSEVVTVPPEARLYVLSLSLVLPRKRGDTAHDASLYQTLASQSGGFLTAESKRNIHETSFPFLDLGQPSTEE